MAAPSYTTDLTTITNAESGTWGEFTGFSTGGTPSLETDFYIEGSACYSQSFGTKTGAVFSIAYDNGSNITFNTGDCLFIWQVCLAGNAIDTNANGGYRVGIGSSINDFNYWHTGGSDFNRNPYGGWQNVAVDPTFTPVDGSAGTPSGYRWFGSILNTVAQISKGNPHGVDKMTYGRGEVIIENGDLGNGYGTFSGIATQNDNQNNRWGLFQRQGTGYIWKGLLSFGTASSSCDFRDNNVNITIDNTPKTYAAFNKIEINNTSSRVDWTNINFTALASSQLSPGNLEVVDNAVFNIDSCSFTDMNTFIFDTSTTVNDTTFRRCSTITQGGASFDNCLFTNSDSSTTMVSDNPQVITNCDFISDGSNHALELNTAGTYTFSGNTFTNYAGVDGSTGNEAVYNTSGSTITLNISGGGDSPSVRNSAGSSTVVNNTVSWTININDSAGNSITSSTEITVVRDSDTSTLYNAENVVAGSTVYSFDGGLSGTAVYINALNVGSYEPVTVSGITLPSTDAEITIQLPDDRVYNNP